MPLTEEQKTLIIEAYNQHSSTHKVAVQFGVSTATVFRVVKAEGVVKAPNVTTDHEKQVIAGLYMSGMSLDSIATQTGRNVSTICRAVKNLTREQANIAIAQERRTSIVDSYLSGKSSHKVAAQFGVSPSTVFNFVTAAGKELRSRKGAIKHKKDEVIRLYTEGRTLDEVAQTTGFALTTVYNLLRQEGVYVRSQQQATTLIWLKPECRSKLMKRFLTWGPNSPSWRGGINTPARQIRASVKYGEWRQAVCERDKYTCQCCGTKRFTVHNPLHVDHIYPFRQLLFDYDVFTLEHGLKCSALWNVDNGRVLCANCHQQTKTWGNGKAISSETNNSQTSVITQTNE